MNIYVTIMCDQLDCIYNDGNDVHHDHLTDRCNHGNPLLLQRLVKKGDGLDMLVETYFCESKNINKRII